VTAHAPTPYRDDLLAHARHPVGAATFPPDDPAPRHVNPACGDEIRLHIALAPDGTIAALTHHTRACAICTASASILATLAPGSTPADLLQLASEIETSLTTATDFPSPPLSALNAIRGFPARRDCALLPWRALRATLPSPP
jgi:nitrogen fixation NifU-like protein